jgi:hypothetical protein
MTVWTDIDRMKAKFERQLADAKEAVRALGGGAFVRADELGWWKCSYRVGGGRVTLRARSPEDLVEQLKAAKAPKAPKAES